MPKELFFLGLAIVGIAILLIISNSTFEKININRLSEKNLNQNIQIEARVTHIRDYPKQNFQVLTLKDSTGNLTAISNSEKQLKLNKNQTYIFRGKLEENFYNNTRTLQLNIDKITYVS